ncbi:armadillo-type protein [Ochromonadaceae sp. CCMP2298]|nr:armadillo-type protein [Ochromonadaceae sp. CCMP2298]
MPDDYQLNSTGPTQSQVIDINDDTAPARLSMLVSSVNEKRRIDTILGAQAEQTRTDAGIKHLVLIAVEKEGAGGVMRLMQEMSEDERVIWRGARTLREMILADDAVKLLCYDSLIEEWLLRLLLLYPLSNVVQAHCIRLIAALAFGNDRFRRKSGERGVMLCLVRAMENHPSEEMVQLHVCTALTNLAHNSLENRSRFVELGGVEVLIGVMVRFKESAKVQRQSCWAVLTLCGSDDISRMIAKQGGDSAIMNAMLTHRFDAGVQQFGCWALGNLALSGEEVCRRLKKKGAAEVCRIALETHGQDAEVLRQARNVLGVLSPLGRGMLSSDSSGAL